MLDYEIVVRRDHALRHCSNCCREVHEAGRIEAGVPYAVYCSRACKSEEDALRSAESSALGKLEGISVARDVDLDLLRMMLRLVVTRAAALGLRPESTQEVNIGGAQEGEQHEEVGARGQASFLLQQWRNLHSLMHHRETMSPSWITVTREAAEDLMQIVPEWARTEVEEVVELACRVNVNAHGFGDDFKPNSVIGVGLFPLVAMVNHSCRPNCTFLYYGGKLAVRTLEGVPAGTELSVSYIDLLQSTAERRQELLATKHFLCACSRCENLDPVDSYLDGVCCLDCGPNGLLTSTRPPSPEDVMAAQLAELGVEQPVSKGKSAPVGGRGNGKKKGNGGIAGPPPTPSPAAIGSGGENGTNGGAAAVNDRVMHCPSCRRQYPVEVVEKTLSRAKVSRAVPMAAVHQAKDFTRARKSLEKWLDDYDAGTAASSSTAKKKPSKKDTVNLHPSNAMVMRTLVPLANCCNFEEDYAASVRYLRRAVSAMEVVYPPNYPEPGDLYAALADAISVFLEERGPTLLNKAKSQCISERKQALEKVAAIRSVCLGKNHPTTAEAMRALARA